MTAWNLYVSEQFSPETKEFLPDGFSMADAAVEWRDMLPYEKEHYAVLARTLNNAEKRGGALVWGAKESKDSEQKKQK